MKKNVLKLLILCMATYCLSNVFFLHTARAEQTIPTDGSATTDGSTTDGSTATEITPTAYQITITQYPSKTIYTRGEDLNLSDMILQAYYMDGTSKAVTDYTVVGYNNNQIGVQTVFIQYQNCLVPINVTVIPAKVTNIKASSNTYSITLTWDAAADISRYEIYSYDETTSVYTLLANTPANSIVLNYQTATIQNIRIVAITSIYGNEYRSDVSDTFTAATAPDIVTGLTVSGTTSNSISLSWNPVAGATGYLIYRSPVTKESYTYVGTTAFATYTDLKLTSGQSYRYKVCAFNYSNTFAGDYSISVDTSTNPAKMTIKYKNGEQKVRLSWSQVNGATSYDIYIGDGLGGFALLTTLKGSVNSYTAEGLVTGSSYTFYGIAHKQFKGVIYDSPSSDQIAVTLTEILATNTNAKIFANKTAFIKSASYTGIPFFGKNVIYTKSFILPGLINTNVGGFTSTTMVPQAITFAGDYLLITAYDSTSEENSVIYIMNKTTRKLLTTVVLSNKSHVGGIGFDGTNIWLSNGTRVSSIPFADVETAVQTNVPYVFISYKTTVSLGIATSYMTYYNDKLWVGSYNELESTYMYSYTIENKDTAPSLTLADTVLMPTRVRGIAFTNKGTLILSRSCQLYKGLRGYMRQLDVYEPAFTEAEDGTISLGPLVNTVEMPSMNEGIAIDGSYLYVNYESSAFMNASYRMDRVTAFKLSVITKKAKA